MDDLLIDIADIIDEINDNESIEEKNFNYSSFHDDYSKKKRIKSWSKMQLCHKIEAIYNFADDLIDKNVDLKTNLYLKYLLTNSAVERKINKNCDVIFDSKLMKLKHIYKLKKINDKYILSEDNSSIEDSIGLDS